ncbi:MAG: DNA polymerase III subunit gamma/tau [Piscirickettsiaceae bacterium CG07_land_8_20_14_0_80_44_28]|nr:MAG: DNA polymerase III subunit gamma/tau [Piscirickettsiaceae bacterium CG07_land_8_20_14_0_80_44_28]
MVLVSDTVLARKWRPKNFSELVGQTHVMQALSNALDQQRLHHAYLFTGTRGVGKTTIARIFSKALNCEQGMSSHPCGVCSVCRSIDEGRFVDLIEVDAASKTKVEDTRELLENVQYAPVQGRYKVYLIDEVHMLSKSSFNALLKTLEEPPAHVKFLLATTDPHKLPMTVLSRCLQFNLMRLTQTQLQQHLRFILTQEAIAFEDAALAMIAKSADGSARDALSILDQAIAYGAGEVQHAAVQAMLGLVDQQFSLAILQALAEDSADGIKQVVKQLAAMGVDYIALNAQLIESFHYLSLLQVLGDAGETSILETQRLQRLAEQMPPERVQMCYQIALLAKQDMALAPDIRIGFEMALLRMLAFQTAETDVVPLKTTRPGGFSTPTISESPAPAASMLADVKPAVSKVTPAQSPLVHPTTVSEPSVSQPDDAILALRKQIEQTIRGDAASTDMASAATKIPAPLPPTSSIPMPSIAPEDGFKVPPESPIIEPMAVESSPMPHYEGQADDTENSIAGWIQLIAALQLDGMAAELARQSILVRQTPQVLTLSVDPEQAEAALTELAFQRLEEQVKAQLGCRLKFVQAQGVHWTPAKQFLANKEAQQAQARNSIEQDTRVAAFKDILNLNVIESSVQAK